jgi:hypothetical protein
MTYTFARVGAAAGKMRVEDVFVQTLQLIQGLKGIAVPQVA